MEAAPIDALPIEVRAPCQRPLSSQPRSSQLAVFAPAAVITAELRRVAIVVLLARDTQPHAGERLSSTLGDLGSALRAMSQRRSLRQAALRSLDAIENRRVDLLLYRPITRPTRCHTKPQCRYSRHPLWVFDRAVASDSLAVAAGAPGGELAQRDEIILFIYLRNTSRIGWTILRHAAMKGYMYRR